MTFRTLIAIFFLSLFAILITGCETDVELNAPYKSTPVIVSVLEYTTDTQFVRINRTFLSDGNPIAYAQVRDSVEYDPSEVEAWLIKKQNGSKLDSILLTPIVKSSREPGVFYDTDITFWHTSEAIFTDQEISNIGSGNSSNLTYQLDVTARGIKYSAETGFPELRNGTIEFPPSNPEFKVEFYRQTSQNYQPVAFRYVAQQPTARYQGVLRFNFDYETTTGETVQNQFIDYQLGISQLAPNEGDNIDRTYSINSESWYAYVGNIIKDIPNIYRVRIANLEFRLTGANNELDAYISVAQPISDFTPVLTLYSNFNNDAIGILGSKTIVSNGFLLTEPSVNIFNTGEYSYGVIYCTQSWPGATTNCQ